MYSGIGAKCRGTLIVLTQWNPSEVDTIGTLLSGPNREGWGPNREGWGCLLHETLLLLP